MVPEGWRSVEIGSVCAAITDCVNKTAPIVAGPTPYRMIRTSNVRDGRVDLSDARYVTEETYSKWSRRGALLDGDIILTREAPVGEVGQLADSAGVFLGQRTVVYRADPQQADQDFLFHAMRGQALSRQYEELSAGGTVAHIRVPDCSKFALHLPPLPEQRKIAEILSTWDRAIETTEALLAAAKAQKRALMQTLLTGKRRFPEFEGQPWREVRLGHLCDVNPRLTTIANDDRLTFLSMDAVSEEGRILRRDEGTTSQYGTGYTRFQDGDVLVAKITPCFENGKGCHATGLINGLGAGSTEFHVLRAKDERDQRFVFQVVNSHPFRTRGEANMQGSAGQRRVPTDFIRAYLVHAPASADERGRIAEVLDEADRLAEEHKTQIEKLRTEKSALMQQLLTGKRRVRV